MLLEAAESPDCLPALTYHSQPSKLLIGDCTRLSVLLTKTPGFATLLCCCA